MSKTDKRRIIFTVMKFLEACEKANRKVSRQELERVTGINGYYLDSVLADLLTAGHLVGVSVQFADDERYVFIGEYTRLTVEGVEYLHDSSIMKKVSDACGSAVLDAIAGIAPVLVGGLLR